MSKSLSLAAAAMALVLAGSEASACDGGGCGYGGGYGYAGYGPPVYGAYGPAAYAAPPVYAYSYFGPRYADDFRGYGPAPQVRFYTTRINVFPGPAWAYSAAYYRSPRRSYRGCPRYRRVHTVSPCRGARAPARVYRPYMYGPLIPVSRRW
jgi:hypothetical protein